MDDCLSAPRPPLQQSGYSSAPKVAARSPLLSAVRVALDDASGGPDGRLSIHEPTTHCYRWSAPSAAVFPQTLNNAKSTLLGHRLKRLSLDCSSCCYPRRSNAIHICCIAHNRTAALLLTASSTQRRPHKRRRNNFSQAPANRPLPTPRCSSLDSQLGRDRTSLGPTPRSLAEKARLLICQRNLRMTSPVPVPRAREIAVQQCDCKLIARPAIGRPLHAPQSFCAVTLCNSCLSYALDTSTLRRRRCFDTLFVEETSLASCEIPSVGYKKRDMLHFLRSSECSCIHAFTARGTGSSPFTRRLLR